MFRRLKGFFYFPLASYFRFFAKIKLFYWKPRVIVVTGSSGKTTTMALIESQLGNKAFYSHHANSSYGIPFNILGLERKTLLPGEWIGLFLLAPLRAFSKNPDQKTYIVEADCDRPGEGKFLSDLLVPEATIWLSSSRTHSMNFDALIEQKKFDNVEEAIAQEYGYFLEATKSLCIINSDSGLISKQTKRTKVEITKIKKDDRLQKYEVDNTGSGFEISGRKYSFKFLLPKAISYSISACIELMKYLNEPIDDSFKDFSLPPGRSSMFKGIKNITIVDSCYNSNLSSATEIINMFNDINTKPKWAVIGDMLEQGKSEREEHEKLARLLAKSHYDRLILLGLRITKFGLPILRKHYAEKIIAFSSPKEVLDYLEKNIEGGETILFKGARFLEGVIEHLLIDKADINKLSRREKVWEKRRKKWDL